MTLLHFAISLAGAGEPGGELARKAVGRAQKKSASGDSDTKGDGRRDVATNHGGGGAAQVCSSGSPSNRLVEGSFTLIVFVF